MAPRVPPNLPREILTLVTVLLVVFLVSFPASSAQVAVVVLVGGGVFLLLSSQRSQKAAEAQMQSVPIMRAAFLATMESKNAQAAEGSTKKPERMDTKETRVPETATPPESSPTGVATICRDVQGKQRQAQLADEPAEAADCIEQPAAKPSAAVANAEVATATPRSTGQSNQPLAGGAAVLARLRQQRAQGNSAAAAAKKEAAAKEVVVAYASQTGTAHEIAKGIQAESATHGIKSRVMSLNELGFEELAAGKAVTMVIVASSTGDGDPPDNSAKFYAAMRRRTQEAGVLKGVRFTCLGLGDSNYTSFMRVSRVIRSRLQELGAEPFHKMQEADEVDGLESSVDPWIEGLWDALKQEIGRKVLLTPPP